jgi:hypothetical protein
MSQSTPAKCARCSHPIEVREAVVTIGPECFHVTCWHILVSSESVRRSKKMARRARQAIEATRERIERALGNGSERSV